MKYHLRFTIFLTFIVVANSYASQLAETTTALVAQAGKWVSKKLDPVSYAGNPENKILYDTHLKTIESDTIESLLNNETFMTNAFRIEERASAAGPALLNAMKSKNIKSVDELYTINKSVLTDCTRLFVEKFIASYRKKLGETIQAPSPQIKQDINELFNQCLIENKIDEAMKIFKKNKDDLSGKSVAAGEKFFRKWKETLNDLMPDEKNNDDSSDDE